MSFPAKRSWSEAAAADEDDDYGRNDRATSSSNDNTTSPLPTVKRRKVVANDDDDSQTPTPTPSPAPAPAPAQRTGRDLLSPLSDELLLRILSFLPSPRHLLAVAPVSRRLCRLASDPHLWKALYYARFVLPRAMRIPGFRSRDREGGGGVAVGGSGGPGHRLHYAGRRALWADGRRGGVVALARGPGGAGKMRKRERDAEEGAVAAGRGRVVRVGEESARILEEEEEEEEEEEAEAAPQPINWMRQYKIRDNWARGKCAVEELKLGGGDAGVDDGGGGRRMLVKVVEGVAVTADKAEGLRAWDLRNRRMTAQINLGDHGVDAAPSSIAVDDAEFEQGVLDVALGFTDGSFGVWRLFTAGKRLVRLYRHEKSSNGELIAMAFSYPYLLTATQSVLVSLYTFDVPSAAGTGQGAQRNDRRAAADNHPAEVERKQVVEMTGKPPPSEHAAAGFLSAPYLLTSLDSHTSRPPLALSIRKTAATTIASVAYTLSTLQGWSIGIQDLHIAASGASVKSAPEITRTRIAYTTPLYAGGLSHSPPTPPRMPRHHGRRRAADPGSSPARASDSTYPEPGPTTLCYSHPYLLATLPDNTLVLYMCTSNASSLSISPGIRLWGHTSGISDAEITARGKAVSVSARGEEMRVWELEGRPAGAGGRSVEIRPGQSSPARRSPCPAGGEGPAPSSEWDERRNWVGFDDEMVIVLKERRGARESLMVYDFT